MKIVHICLEENFEQRIKDFAKQRSLSKSSACKILISESLERRELPNPN